MYKHILVTLDGSPIAEQALPHAETLSKTLGARLTVLSVVEPYIIALPPVPTMVPAYNIDTDVQGLERERNEYLDNMSRGLAERGTEADVVLREGKAADEILLYANEQDVDLIIMTTHGKSGLSRFIYGSVAESVLHGSKVPVLLVKAKAVD